ncbi:MAG: c-type cytochrome [Janthinobacterium lividum]
MSEAQGDTLFKSPAKFFAAMVAAFIIPVAVILLVVSYVSNFNQSGAGTESMTPKAIDERVAPIASVEIRDANAPRVYQTGEAVFKAVCSACHATGAAGAPKFGNAGDWAPRIAQGFETLWKTALTGKGAMPPRGGTSPDDYSDYEIGRAVAYMANNAGAHFADPPAPASGAAAAAGASGAAAGASGAAAAGASGASAVNPPGAGAPVQSDTGSTQSTPVVGPAAASGAAAGPAPTASAVPQAAAATTAAATGMGAAPSASGGAAATTGKALYTQVCATCHAAGVVGAPKFGNKADWAPRLKDPMPVIYNYALHGKGVMPPKGGSNASDDDVKAAVDYMVNAAR